ncbi:MAG: hypothetical protein H0Z25_03600 [Kosmotoga sp.]|uniref:hypothetical protein n=1 Tax=Kosmotoga sp. TaxID=1955248 RepID=UPI001DF86139|nr:hypothetical protein [Kosmotoga sp.]MBO8166285.1 hypothetical protein [Kosmotoga sp.]
MLTDGGTTVDRVRIGGTKIDEAMNGDTTVDGTTVGGARIGGTKIDEAGLVVRQLKNSQ